MHKLKAMNTIVPFLPLFKISRFNLSGFRSTNISFFCLAALAALLLLAAAPVAQAATDSVGSKILIGMINDQSGPTKGFGNEMRRCAEVAFKKVNASGGINGRMVEQVVWDDMYDPKKSFEMAKEAVEVKKVFALIGATGTATSKAMQPVFDTAKVPFIAPFSGSDFLRSPFDRMIFPTRDYNAEAEELVKYIVDDLKIKEVGLFTQNDGFGDAAKRAVYGALAKRNLKRASEGNYAKDMSDIEAAIAGVLKGEPKAIIMFSIMPPTVAFLKKARELNYKGVLAGASPGNFTKIMTDIGKASEEVLFTDVFPSTNVSKLKIVDDLNADMKAAGEANPTPSCFEGYFAARLTLAGIEKAGKNLSTTSFVNALESMGSTDIGGLSFDFRKDSRKGLAKVFLFKIKDAKTVQLN
jgi:branched-chain amino acid transport system substrate-binding protein